jgi:hypothetical protein
MKIKCIRIEECEGKTIAGASHNCNMILLRFSDGTICAMQSDMEYDDSTFIECRGEIDASHKYWRHEAWNAGVISKEQLEEFNAQDKSREMEKRRAEFERLKQEFSE